MKRSFIIVLWLPLASSCAESDGKEKIPAIETAPSIKSESARREAYSRFESALETAPYYGSETRSALIDNPFKYRASYRSGSAEFANLPKQFRCPHDKTIIENLTLQAWDIVKCDVKSVTFYRRHSEADDVGRRCFDGVAGAKKKDIGDEFETLIVGFENFTPKIQSDKISMKAFMQRVSLDLPGDRIERERLEPFRPLGAFKDADFFVNDWGRFVRYYGMDEERRRLVQFDLRANKDCKRNPMGWALTQRHTITLDSPQPSIQAMDETLSDILALLDGENN